jgi:heptosyltransferase II
MRSPALPSTAAPGRILVRGVNWVGDAVMTTPALQRLREALPGSQITLLTHEKLADLWRGHPALDAVLTFAPGESPWSVARRLRANLYDTALVLPNSPRSALEAWLARIPQRIGYVRPCWSWLLTKPVASRPGKVRMPRRSVTEVKRLVNSPSAGAAPAGSGLERTAVHQLHDYLHLAAVLGANPQPLPPDLVIASSDLEQAKTLLRSELRSQQAGCTEPDDLLLLGLNPGAEYGPAKRWPAESFAAVAREIAGTVDNCTWLAFGTAKDAPLCDEIARLAGSRVLNLAGKTSLRQLMALLKLCRLVLTNDSGPMHVAAALGTPVVVPFGSTSPELTGPGLPGDSRHRLLKSGAACSPCFRRACPIDFRCMTGIRPAQVVQAVLQALGDKQASPSGPP